MKIMFVAATGVHQALVAAYYFIGQVQDDHYSRLKGFADSSLDTTGFPLLIYDDENGNQVYTLGVGNDIAMACKTIDQFINILGFDSEDLLVKPVNIRAGRLLLWLERIPPRPGMKMIGVCLAEIIVKWQEHKILQSVQEVKKTLAQRNAEPKYL